MCLTENSLTPFRLRLSEVSERWLLFMWLEMFTGSLNHIHAHLVDATNYWDLGLYERAARAYAWLDERSDNIMRFQCIYANSIQLWVINNICTGIWFRLITNACCAACLLRFTCHFSIHIDSKQQKYQTTTVDGGSEVQKRRKKANKYLKWKANEENHLSKMSSPPMANQYHQLGILSSS